MTSQTRQEINDKILKAQPQIVRDPYVYLLLELILDVLVDVRDSMPAEPVDVYVTNAADI